MADFILGEGLLAGGLSFLYGLQEGQGAVTAGDVSGVPGRPKLSLVQIGAGGSVEFGTSGIMPEGVACLFSPDSSGNGMVLADSGVAVYIGADCSLVAQFAWSGDTGARLMQVGTSPHGRVWVDITPTTVVATFVGSSGTSATATAAVVTNDGRPHFVCVSLYGSSASVAVDDESQVSVTAPSDMEWAHGLIIGGTTSADAVQIAWVGHRSGALPIPAVAELASLATGGAVRSDAVVRRVCRWVGVDGDLTAEDGASSVAYVATGGADGLDIINTANEIEAGVFFATGDGRLVQHSRSHRYNARPTLEIPASAIASSVVVTVDTSRLVNDVTVSRPAGATYRARNTASIAKYGARTAASTLYAASDSDLEGAAGWMVGRYGDVAPRIPGVTINLMSASAELAASVLALEVGDLIRITGLPPQTPGGGGGVVDLFVEGLADRISALEWSVSIATSPATSALVGQLGYTALGSDFAIAY